jgi:Ankyrin repeats (many copies)
LSKSARNYFDVIEIYIGVVKSGRLNILIWFHNKYSEFRNPKGNLDSTSLCHFAAKRGNLEMLRWLIDNKFPIGNGIVHSAAESGNRGVVGWLLDRGYNWWQTSDVFLCQNYDFVKWCLERGCLMDDLQNTLKRGNDSFDPRTFAYLDQHYNLDWFRSIYSPPKIKPGRLRYVEFMINRGFRLPDVECRMFSDPWRSNDPELVKFLIRRQKINWTPKVCAGAASRGHFEFLKWVREQGLQIYESDQSWGCDPQPYIAKWMHRAALAQRSGGDQLGE